MNLTIHKFSNQKELKKPSGSNSKASLIKAALSDFGEERVEVFYIAPDDINIKGAISIRVPTNTKEPAEILHLGSLVSGVGTLLLKYVESFAKSKGHKTITLEAYENTGAEGFYSKLGYTRVNAKEFTFTKILKESKMKSFKAFLAERAAHTEFAMAQQMRQDGNDGGGGSTPKKKQFHVVHKATGVKVGSYDTAKEAVERHVAMNPAKKEQHKIIHESEDGSFVLDENMAVYGKYTFTTHAPSRDVAQGQDLTHVKANKGKLKGLKIPHPHEKDGLYGPDVRVTVTNNDTGAKSHHFVYQSGHTGTKPIMSIRSHGGGNKYSEEHAKALSDHLTGK